MELNLFRKNSLASDIWDITVVCTWDSGGVPHFQAFRKAWKQGLIANDYYTAISPLALRARFRFVVRRLRAHAVKPLRAWASRSLSVCLFVHPCLFSPCFTGAKQEDDFSARRLVSQAPSKVTARSSVKTFLYTLWDKSITSCLQRMGPVQRS